MRFDKNCIMLRYGKVTGGHRNQSEVYICIADEISLKDTSLRSLEFSVQEHSRSVFSDKIFERSSYRFVDIIRRICLMRMGVGEAIRRMFCFSSI